MICRGCTQCIPVACLWHICVVWIPSGSGCCCTTLVQPVQDMRRREEELQRRRDEKRRREEEAGAQSGELAHQTIRSSKGNHMTPLKTI